MIMMMGNEPLAPAVEMCTGLALRPKSIMFFAGKLIFQRETWYQGFLHNETAASIQHHLQWLGFATVILSVRIWGEGKKMQPIIDLAPKKTLSAQGPLKFHAISAVLLCSLLRICVNAHAQEQPSTPPTSPGETVTLRGTLRNGQLGASGGTSCALTLAAEKAAEFEGLDIEVSGRWRDVNGKPAFEPTREVRVLVPATWSLPFALLLASIALMPFINKHFWEHNYRRIAIGLGLVTVLLYLFLLKGYGQQRMVETLLDYFKFMALIGSLFVVTGGILIDVTGGGRPALNTLILAVGAVIANLFGTTGASALLIRPFLRINKDRIRPFHVVFFIFIVSNCGGALTPIGDPPLFLGYIYGVPFRWTIEHCWPAWAMVIGLLLTIFFVLDRWAAPPGASGAVSVRVSGLANLLCLLVVLAAVFADRLVAENVSKSLESLPIGALIMILAAATAYKLARLENLARNEFNFGPILEVGFLFAGIFATMVPALDYLAANAAQLNITTPLGFYYGSGALSSVLDNAPTYLSFLSAAHGLAGLPLTPENMPRFLASHERHLLAISLGSVFFGACTYIGNGPNFMVKAIADSSGAPTPNFIGYIVKYTLLILLPIYVLVGYLFL